MPTRTALTALQTFATASSTDLTAYTGIGGVTWSSPQGTGRYIVDPAGLLVQGGGFIGYYAASATPASADQAVTLGVTRRTGPDGMRALLLLRYDTATGNQLTAEYDNNNEYWRVYEITDGAGTVVELGRQTATLTTGTEYTADLQAIGSAVTFTVNGTTVYSGTTTRTATGAVGLGAINGTFAATSATTSLTVDNWQAFDVAAGGGSGGAVRGTALFVTRLGPGADLASVRSTYMRRSRPGMVMLAAAPTLDAPPTPGGGGLGLTMRRVGAKD